MIRKIKAFALALWVMVAFSAIAAGGAQAGDNFKYGASSGTIAGNQQGGNHIFTIAGGRSFECDSILFFGSFTEAEPTTQNAFASHSGCKVDVLGEEFPMTIDMTDCFVEFAHTAGGGKFEGHTFLRCPGGDAAHARLYADAAPHESLGCEWTVAEHGPLTTVEYENNAGSPNHGTIDINVSAIPYTRTNNNLGSIVCGPASGTATYVGNSTAKAKNTSGEAVSGEVA